MAAGKATASAGGVAAGVTGAAGVDPLKAVEFNPATMTAPVFISGPNPEYTRKALDHGVEGVMTLRCLVTRDGEVRQCDVRKSLPFMDRAVISALERRRYKPATLKGVTMTVYYTFSLKLVLPR
jgi:protein TonB